MKNKEKTPTRILFYLTSLYIFVLILIRLIASFYPDLRLWGFSHAAYIDGMIFIYPLLFVIALLIAYRTYRKPNIFPSLNEKLSKKDIFFSFAVLVGTAAVFISFSVEEYFLGDGYQLISWLANPLLGLKTRAYGEMYIHQEFSRLSGGTGESPVINAFKIISILSGVIFITSFLYYGKKLTETKFQYYSIVLLGIISAIALQFFGYVELYSVTIAMLTIFFLSGVTALKYSKKSMVPLITFGLAVFLHKLALIFFPTLLIYLLYLAPAAKLQKGLSKNTNTLFVVMVAIFAVAYTFALTVLPIYWQQSFLPPLEGQFTTDNYYLLSENHLIDFLNLLFFMIPITIFVFIAGFFIKHRDNIENPIALFLGSSALFGILAAFVLEPKLGMARDWDFMAVALLGAHITGVYYWITQYKSNRYFQPATIILLLIGLSILIPWISLHNSPDALYSYTKDALIRDPKHGRTGMEYFITYHERMGNPTEKRNLQMLFLRYFPEKSMFVQAQSMLENKKYV